MSGGRHAVVRIATRGSALARWQAEFVAGSLRRAHPGLEVDLLVVDTVGDRRLDIPVWELGGQGVFVKEVQAAVLDGRADLAVHSTKDLPSEPTAGLRMAAVPPRGDPRDALVGVGLGDLPPGATVGTGSVRRRAQLAWLRPDLTFVGLRGNIGTRMGRIPPGGAVVVAAAALERLGLDVGPKQVLAPSVMLPQVGQGAIGVECNHDDTAVAALLAAIDDPPSHVAVRAERAFLAQLGSGCSLPVGAYATVWPESPTADGSPAGAVSIEGMIASIDGRVLMRAGASGAQAQPEALGAALALDLLDRFGGRAVLDADGAGARPWPSTADVWGDPDADPSESGAGPGSMRRRPR